MRFNMRIARVLFFLITTGFVAIAQGSPGASWVGVWQAELDGQPSAILTLANDSGTLEGTLVLNGISRGGGEPHVAVREAHVLMRPRVDGHKLSFNLKRLRNSEELMSFTVDFVDSESATLHCSNCGSDAPVVQLTKLE